MYTPDFVWNQITNWIDKGLSHHKKVAELIKTDKALNEYVADNTEPELSVLDAKTVVAAVEARAEHLALRDGANSPLSQSIAGARQAIARTGIKAARENIDYYRDQLTERFESAARTYVTESAKLPEVFAGADLAGFDTETFAAYQATKEAFAEIKTIRDFLSSLTLLMPGGGTNSRFNVRFLVLDPGTVENYTKVQFSDPVSTDRIYEAVDPVMMRAVRNGAELRIATPHERDAECTEYEAELDAKHATETARVKAGVGTSRS